MNVNDWQAIEKDVAKNKTALIERMVNFALNDVLLFWSTDEKVQKEQEKKWTPIIVWANETVNVEFKKTSTLEVSNDNVNTASQLKEYLSSLSNKELSAFYVAALNMRSVLLALALVKEKISAKEAFELSELEELYQARKWGSEPVAEARRNSIKNILVCTEEYLRK
ncbi:MAG: hypothetical protein IJW75_05775 [Alphaproteobacteria bacterium]|nr:hypothetical protein [Alphaproteobacteria bacterium]